MKAYFVILILFVSSYPKALKNYEFAPKKELRTQTSLFNNLPKEERNRLFSLFAGEKRGLSKKDKEAFSEFGLFHLLTPSGLHYSSLLKIPKFIFPFYILIPINLILFIVLKLTDSFNAISRVALFSFLKSFPLLTTKMTFTLAFIIDLLTIHFFKGGLSYLLSFFFWGTILFFKGSKLKLIYLLFINQYIFSLLSNTLFNPFSLIINPLMTALFNFYYPGLIVSSLISFLIPITPVLKIYINVFFEIVLFFENIFHYFHFYPTTLILVFLLFLLFYKNKKLIFILLLLNSEALTPNFKVIFQGRNYVFEIKKSEIKKFKYNDMGLKIYGKNKACQYKLAGSFWNAYCKKTKL